MDGLEVELDTLERVICHRKEPDSLDFQLLRRLTGNFSDDRRIGEGGCGEVYKGILPNEVVIAVKKLKNSHTIDEKMFLREVDSMIKVGHQNIVRFIGYCSETKEKAVQMDGRTVMAEERERLLCFEYLRKGSLDNYLSDELRGLEWHTRYQIIKGICYGLLHLHKEKRILHMDLKPANILLSDQMVPKITDFGLSRIEGISQTTSAQRLLSPGYCAPEYVENGKRSWKSDIYSLGVIMIELVTGSKQQVPNITKVLRRWRHRWSESSKHIPLWYQQLKNCLELAVSCMQRNPINRPFIWDIVRELNKLDNWDGQIRESSLEKISSSPDDMLGIEPLELHFTLAHEKQISCSIQLKNDTDYYMAFRIATTSLLPFSIQPDKGIAAPRSKCASNIILSSKDMKLLHYHREEDFVVQSTRIDGSLTSVDITVETFNDDGGNSKNKIGDDEDKIVDEVNLMVVFDMPLLHEVDQKDQLHLSAEMYKLECFRDMGDLQHILEGSKRNHIGLHFLVQMTKNFSVERMVGGGEVGKVYKGIIGNKILAVKDLDFDGTIDDSAFEQCITTMMEVEHHNIVRILGYCREMQRKFVLMSGRLVTANIMKRLVCFEYINNGSLEQHLTDELRGHEWHTRYRILQGICEGLQYLHKERLTIHLALKPSNVLIDDNMVPKITDIGLSSLIQLKTVPSQTATSPERFLSRLYCAPEFVSRGRISAKCDIYSLGIIIIELVTGSKTRPNINNVLRRWRHRWNKSAKYTPLWHQQVTKCLEWHQQITKCLELALRCLNQDPTQRPDISDVIHELNESDRINSCLDDMLGIEPLEIHFPFKTNTGEQCSIQLTNDTGHYIAFMILTESALAISMQPNKEIVPPRSMYSVTITLQAQDKEPETAITRWKKDNNKITVLSTRVDAGVTATDISEDMFNEEEDKVIDKVSVMLNLGLQ